MQLPLFVPKSDWRPPEALPTLAGRRRISLDTETHDPELTTHGPGWARKSGKLVGVSIGVELESGATEGIYLPLRHREGGNLDPVTTLAWLRDQLHDYEGELVGHTLHYDLGWLSTEGIEAPRAKLVDVAFAEALLDENQQTYGLDAILKRNGLSEKRETLLRIAAATYGVDPKHGLWKLHASFVGAYAERDATGPLDLWKIQRPLLERDDLLPVLAMETRLIPILLDMRRRGIRIDLDRAERERERFKKLEVEATAEVERMSGVRVDIWESKSLERAFDAVGLPLPRTPTGLPSVTADWLKAQHHPLAGKVLAARQTCKLRRDFIESAILNKVVNGRIYGEFHQLRSDEGGAVSGRFTATNPNLQQAPARTVEGRIIRSLFLPEEGALWCSADYSQQEPRFTVHYAAKLDLPGARAAAARFIADPNTDYHSMVAELAHIPRVDAKTINLGVAYGMGGLKLCRSLGLPTKWVEGRNGGSYEVPGDEGEALMRKYHAAIPYVRPLSDTCEAMAQRRGWIRTFGGRLCRFPWWEPAWKRRDKEGMYLVERDRAEAVAKWGQIRRAFTSKALNRLIQGSGADCIKLAMIDARNFALMITMHDELGASVGSEAEARELGRTMENCVELMLPMKVDVKLGHNWGESK